MSLLQKHLDFLLLTIIIVSIIIIILKYFFSVSFKPKHSMLQMKS